MNSNFKLQLYDDQIVTVNKLRGALRSHKRVLLQSPTGSGKTAMATYMHNRMSGFGKRSWFICHRRELIDQTASTFSDNGLDFGIIAAGFRPEPDKKIHICSVGTLANRIKYGQLQKPDAAVWDECHHLGANGWRAIQDYCEESFHIGLSATPSRLSGEGLDRNFDCMIKGLRVRQLIDMGRLSEYELFSIPSADLSNVGTLAGEYKSQDVDREMDKPKITGDIVKHWREKSGGGLTIGFASSVKMSMKYAKAFNDAGIPAAHIDANTQNRSEVLQAFARGEIKVVWNVGLFGEGYDISANSGIKTAVTCLLDAAPTKALGAWLQRCGRVLRVWGGVSVILDFAGNYVEHGAPCDDHEWSLEGVIKAKDRKDGSTIATKACTECYKMHRAAPSCPFCGHVYPIKSRTIKHVDGELVQVTEKMKEERRKRMQQGMASDIQSLVALGHSEETAIQILKSRAEKSALRNELITLQKLIPTLKFTTKEIRALKPRQIKRRIELLKRIADMPSEHQYSIICIDRFVTATKNVKAAQRKAERSELNAWHIANRIPISFVDDVIEKIKGKEL